MLMIIFDLETYQDLGVPRVPCVTLSATVHSGTHSAPFRSQLSLLCALGFSPMFIQLSVRFSTANLELIRVAFLRIVVICLETF
jgi:hypothetical protein